MPSLGTLSHIFKCNIHWHSSTSYRYLYIDTMFGCTLYSTDTWFVVWHVDFLSLCLPLCSLDGRGNVKFWWTTTKFIKKTLINRWHWILTVEIKSNTLTSVLLLCWCRFWNIFQYVASVHYVDGERRKIVCVFIEEVQLNNEQYWVVAFFAAHFNQFCPRCIPGNLLSQRTPHDVIPYAIWIKREKKVNLLILMWKWHVFRL